MGEMQTGNSQRQAHIIARGLFHVMSRRITAAIISIYRSVRETFMPVISTIRQHVMPYPIEKKIVVSFVYVL